MKKVKKGKKEPSKCENCGEVLTVEEALNNGGWCDECNEPEGDEYA